MAATALADIGVDPNIRDASHVLHPQAEIQVFQEFGNRALHVWRLEHLWNTSEEFVVSSDETAVVLDTCSRIDSHILIRFPARQKPRLAAVKHQFLHQALEMQQLEKLVQHLVVHLFGSVAVEVQRVVYRFPEAPAGRQGEHLFEFRRFVEAPWLRFRRCSVRRLGDEQALLLKPFGDPLAKSAALRRLAGSHVGVAVEDVVLSPFISGN